MTGLSATKDARAASQPGRSRSWGGLLGVLPFMIFAILFLVLPSTRMVVGSFQDNLGNFTLANYEALGSPVTLAAYQASVEISLFTALLGGITGLLMAYAVIAGGLPRILRTALSTFSGVASNFAGVPLALAFVFTFGRVGLVTVFFRGIGIDPYAEGFTLYSKLGLELVYLYFQLPLMILIIAPAIDGLRREWREASENLGATSLQFWRHIGIPILMPAILGSIVLLFGNAFGAQATAYQLTGGFVNLITIVISDLLSGDVLHEPGKGMAMAIGMVGIMGLTLIAYTFLQRRSERWRRA